MESLAELAAAVPDLIIEVPNRRAWFSLRLDQLPATLAADIKNWLAADQGTDPRLRRARVYRPTLPRRKPIRPRTAASYQQILLEFMTMETRAGVPLESLNTLADVVDLNNVDRGLAEYERHFKGEKRRHLGQVMRIVCLVARHWAGLSSEEVADLWAWAKDVGGPRHGMTPKNKSILLSLRDPHCLARLLGLGAKVIKEVLAKPRIRRRDAVRAQTAFAVALLLTAPARIGNIASIHLDRHLRRVGIGAAEQVFIEFCASEVKNERDLRYKLNEITKELLVLYLTRIRSKLTEDPENRWLFPGEGDAHKGSALLSAQIGDLTEEIVGYRITAHQFRHIMGFLHLARSGNDISTVAKALGNDEQTARQFYAWLPQEEALKNWDDTLKLKQEELAPLIDGTAAKPHRPRQRAS
jgi:integrase